MATYNFSALSSGQAISFNPGSDILNFDQTAISAANLQVALQGSDTHITVLSGTDAGKSITLLSTMPPQLATSNVHFANGSALLFGDNSPSTAGDDANNVIPGTNGADLIMGFGGNDVIAGGEGNDSILGGAGNDTLYGDGGNDWIEGGAGNDLVAGSGDQDSIAFREFGAANADTVSGFASDWDNIQLDAAAFSAIGTSGRFAANDVRFYAAPGATGGHDADDRIIYNTTTGQLFYDADGNGPGAAQLIATLDGAPTLLATDINVFGTPTPPPPPPPSGQTINGTSGNDTLTGGSGNDTINGFAGDDSLSGLDGNDSLVGGDGNDTLDGGPGQDTMDGGQGDDTYYVTAGDILAPDPGGTDTVIATNTGWTLGSGYENLTLRGSATSSVGTGNELNNRIVNEGQTGLDGTFLDGRDGNDTLVGGGTFRFTSASGNYGNDSVIGNGNGILDFSAEQSAVTVDFRTGTVVGGGTAGSGSVTFEGIQLAAAGSLNDVLIDNDAGNWLYGGAGNDTLIGGAGNESLYGDGTLGDHPQSASGNDSISGGGGNDYIDGGRGNDTIDGGTGDDTLNFNLDTGLYGNDTVTGGAGVDVIQIWNQTAMVVDLGAGTATGGEGGGDGSMVISAVENFTVYGAGSLMTGDAGANELRGGDGRFGGLANYSDTINGAGGNDTLFGGLGNDHFVFDQTPGAANADLITDFATNADKIHLDARVMSALGTTGAFTTGDVRFYAAPGATGGHDADDRVIYDTSTGNLYYDADGSGAGAAQILGTIFFGGTPASMAATDIVVDNGTSPGQTINGTSGNDTLTGTSGNDTINGFGGDDSLDGASGGDSIDGGAGNDTLTGGAGADQFIFDQTPNASNADVITDFATAADTIQLDASVMGALGSPGRMSAGDARFSAGQGEFSNTVLHYDTTTGNLWYESDPGNMLVDPQLIATLSGAPTLAATDITVVGQANKSIVGTNGNDSLNGGDGNDTIQGLGGNDTLNGGPGNDSLDGGAGDDSLNGGSGADTLIGGDGNDTLDGWAPVLHNAPEPTTDTLDGGLGNDVYFADNTNDVLTDAGGIDTVMARTFDWTLAPGFENLTLFVPDEGGTATGNELDNVIDVTHSYKADAFGLGGNDLLIAGVKNDLSGGDGNDTLIANGEISSLDGGNGNDVLTGQSNDDLTGGSGADNFLFVTSGANDFINDFASGVDRITLDAKSMTQLGASGEFSANDPRFYAGPAAHDADDRVIFTGVDLLYDPDGNGPQAASKLAMIGSASGGNVVATDIWVINGTAGGGGGGGGTPPPPPPGSMVGTEGNDTLIGTAGSDTIYGQGGNDWISGGEGNDSIVGGAGNDTLYGDGGGDWIEGGAGNDFISPGGDQDSIVFREFGAANADTVTEFASDWDKLQLDAAGFSAIGATGRFAAGDVRFYAAAGATGGHDADDRIVYDTTTGNLYYDADGNGAGAAQLIATLDGARPLIATDINVFGTPTPPPPPPGTINGTAGNDTLTGTPGNDTINGLDGNDSITGAGGLDSLVGGNGNDTLDGTSAAFNGGEAQEADTLDGGMGDDTYIVGANDIILADPGGIDTVRTLDTSWTLGAGLDNLILGQSLRFDGSSGTGNELDNLIDAGGLDHSGMLSGLGGNDTIFTGQNSGMAFGGDGNDVLHDGGKGFLSGGLGNDTLIGGSATVFVFDVAPGAANADQITNFNLNTIQLDGTVYANSGPSGQFVTNDPRFFSGAGATSGHDADDRVVYDTSTGNLWYDADGSGAGAAQLIATLQGAPAVNAQNISIVNGSGGGLSITGTSGNDSLNGTAGDDTINGLAGDDTINGLGGNDTLIGSDGNDRLDGGDGNDQVDGGSGNDLEIGGAGNDIVGSSDWSHSLFADADGGADTLDGGLGNDTFFAQSTDTLVDAGGIDTVMVQGISWTLAAGFENLTFYNHANDNGYKGLSGTGNDLDNTINALQGADGIVARGLGGNDSLVGTFYSDTLDGGLGNDTLIGLSGGPDTYVFNVAPGAANADTVGGSVSDPPASGNFLPGIDKIELDGTAYTNIGASGNFATDDARFYAAPGASAGHDADDRVVYNTTTGQLWYDADGNGAGAAQLIATLQGAPAVSATDIEVINGTTGQTINGTAGNDSLVGGAGNDTINGLAGNDTIDGGAGTDSMVGGPGDDLYFVDNPGDVIVEQNLEGFDEVRSTAPSYALSDWINNLTLLPGAGNGTGNAIDNVITGNGAANGLSGGDGNDTLIGAGGNDTFTGGNGADAFVFNVAPGTANAGLITDFASATDMIRLDGRAMTAIGPSGTFASGDVRFYAAGGANGGHDADDRVVYNVTTGQLWYDADGSGSGAAQLIATLQGAPSLAATDIAVDNGSSAPPPPPPGSIVGTQGNDTMPGTAGNDSMFGLGGNDVMAGGGGNDSIVGGAGNDTIYGDSGNDWIEGGAGNDSLSGSGDQDSYVFREYGAANADTVGDFASAWDMLRFDGTAFGALGGAGHFAAGDARFYAAAGASGGHDADDRIIYNTSTGQLFYDADGSGGGAAQLVATVQGAPAVAAADIWVI